MHICHKSYIYICHVPSYHYYHLNHSIINHRIIYGYTHKYQLILQTCEGLWRYSVESYDFISLFGAQHRDANTEACSLLILRNRPGGAQIDTEPSVEQVTNSRLRPRPFPGWVNQRTCLTHLKEFWKDFWKESGSDLMDVSLLIISDLIDKKTHSCP